MLDIFSLFYSFFFSFLKKVKPFIRSGLENKKSKLSHIYTKNLLFKKMLTLHQSFQAKNLQNSKKKIDINHLRKDKNPTQLIQLL